MTTSRTGPDGSALVTATAVVASGVLLTMLPMHSVFTDWSWLVVCAGCALPYVGVVAAFRRGGGRNSAPVVLGLFAAVLVVCWVFVPQHLLLGILPTHASWGDVRALLHDARDTMQNDRAPLTSTPGLRLLTAVATVLLVAFTDVLCILWRKPLLAAAPLLEVLAVASATSEQAAGPIYFAAAAIGFLLILLAGTRLADRDWGPSVDGSGGRLGGARRMAVTGILAALLLPLLLPTASTNLLARASHHGGADGSGGKGQTVELNTTADLSGSLKRGSPVDLIRVSVTPTSHPFYLRQVVLDQFTSNGWVPSPASANYLQPLLQRGYPLAPSALKGVTDSGPAQQLSARFTILDLGGNTLPMLANPSRLDPLGPAVWDVITGTVQRAPLSRDLTYSEDVSQPQPTDTQLRSAPDWTPTGIPEIDARLAAVPAGLPTQVKDLAARLTAGATNSYDKARAISSYFTDPQNGFVYSLDTAPGDGRNALLAFLDNKRGFCQQYAAAAAVLMRVAGLPSRVVLGYTHRPQDTFGGFVVTTADAHAWVEVYFSGVGWVPFDPTPLIGADAERAVALPWAPHTTAPASSAAAVPSATNSAGASHRPDESSGRASAAAVGASGHGSVPWATIGVILLVTFVITFLLIGPRVLRTRQRRRRLSLARDSGSPEPLWQELAASAADRGVLWPDTLTVGQVPDWLARHGVDQRGLVLLRTVAGDVERSRYSAEGGATTSESVSGLDLMMRRWERRDSRQRWRSWWLPRSLVNRSDLVRR